MAHLYKKVKNGRVYYYIRETQRVYGRPTTVTQVYLGSPDKVQGVLAGEDGGFSPKEFGSVFVLNELDRAVDLAGLVNQVLPPKKRVRGPTLGDLIYYATLNRAIAPTSKRHLAAWYETTDIQRIRPLRLGSLNSQNFWNHWDRIGDLDLGKIVAAFFTKVHDLMPLEEKHLLVEATHISAAPRALNAAAGGSQEKAGPPQSRLGLAVVRERASGIPLYYTTFPGELSEAEFFARHLPDLLDKVCQLGVTVKDLTLMFNQGLDSRAVREWTGSPSRHHFLTEISLDAAPDLAAIPLQHFHPLPWQANRRLRETGEEEEPVLYYEGRVPLGDRTRRVIITFDPKVYQKEYQDLNKKVQKLHKKLSVLKKKYHPGKRLGADPQALQAHLVQLCQRLEFSPTLVKVSFAQEGPPHLALQLQHHQLERSLRRLGKSVLITDHEEWEAPDISRAFLRRCVLVNQVEEANTSTQVALMPLYHWTASKIQVHLFVCVAALTYLALLGQRLEAAGLSTTPKEALEEMRSLRSAIYFLKGEGRLKRVLERVSDSQRAILQSLGCEIPAESLLPG